MGGAAPLLGRTRALALAVAGAALVAYGAAAEQLWGLRSSLDIAVHALVTFPAFAAAIWLAVPFARGRSARLLGSAAISALVALALALLGLGSVANVAKLACFTLAGFWFLSLFEVLWWVALVAVLVPWVDIWSVARGPTRYVVEQKPGLFDHISLSFPNPGEKATVNLGPPDVIFFALFLAAAQRYRLRVAWTWLAMTGFLSLTLVLAWKWEVLGLPALPAIALGFLLPNADLIWRHVREERESAKERAAA